MTLMLLFNGPIMVITVDILYLLIIITIFILGQTYFFKDKLFWSFDDRKMNVAANSPQSLSKFWFEFICKNVTEDIPFVQEKFKVEINSSESVNSKNIFKLLFSIFIFTRAFLYLNFYNF